jgi:hypothetical protein
MGNGDIYFTRQLIKRLPEVARDVLTVWIKVFASVELTEPSVDAGVPRPSTDVRN